MKILIADDERAVWLTPLSEICIAEGHSVHGVSDGKEIFDMAVDSLRTFKVALLDYKMPVKDGLEAGRYLLQHCPGMMVVMLTVHADRLTAGKIVAAMRLGFYDYLDKNSEYKRKLKEILKIAAAREETKRPVKDVPTLDEIVGNCSSMADLRRLIQTVAVSNATVLILGESGTGKELIAGAVHSLSERRSKKYIRINCAAIPETLLESELFGHEKGAFTGAITLKLGRVEEANGGTMFLDEIADMSQPLQAKLLRFLEDGAFIRVGGLVELKVDVRLIAATNRDIITDIGAGRFREDLYHRLNVVQMCPPPLRERGEDIILLANHFLSHFKTAKGKTLNGFTAAATSKLRAHHWPGNVRELRNAIERAVILESSDVIQAGSLPEFQLEMRLHRGPGVTHQPYAGGLPTLPRTAVIYGSCGPNQSPDVSDEPEMHSNVYKKLDEYETAAQTLLRGGEKVTITAIAGALKVTRQAPSVYVTQNEATIAALLTNRRNKDKWSALRKLSSFRKLAR